jgi:hypothetical protein
LWNAVKITGGAYTSIQIGQGYIIRQMETALRASLMDIPISGTGSFNLIYPSALDADKF